MSQGLRLSPPCWMQLSQPCLFFPKLLQKKRLQEHTQLALCLRQRQSKAAGDAPLPIKVNGTKDSCVLHKFHLPGSLLLLHSLTKPLSGLSCLLGVFGIGQKPSLKRKGPGVNRARRFTHTTHTHAYIHMHTHIHIHMYAHAL